MSGPPSAVIRWLLQLLLLDGPCGFVTIRKYLCTNGREPCTEASHVTGQSPAGAKPRRARGVQLQVAQYCLPPPQPRRGSGLAGIPNIYEYLRIFANQISCRNYESVGNPALYNEPFALESPGLGGGGSLKSGSLDRALIRNAARALVVRAVLKNPHFFWFGGGWRLAVGGGWRLAVGGWWMVVGGWWLALRGWQLVHGGCP